jgi:hypothetical protein
VALGGKKNDKWTRHNIASERLDAALLRLEKAMAKKAKFEKSAYLKKMAALVLENDKLSDVNKVVEERLNGAIKNLKKILKEA